MAKNFHEHVILNLWLLSFLDVKSMNCYVWVVVERVSNRDSHKAAAALKSAVWYTISNIPKNQFVMTYSWFRQPVENILVADGGFNE